MGLEFLDVQLPSYKPIEYGITIMTKMMAYFQCGYFILYGPT